MRVYVLLEDPYRGKKASFWKDEPHEKKNAKHQYPENVCE